MCGLQEIAGDRGHVRVSALTQEAETRRPTFGFLYFFYPLICCMSLCLQQLDAACNPLPFPSKQHRSPVTPATEPRCCCIQAFTRHHVQRMSTNICLLSLVMVSRNENPCCMFTASAARLFQRPPTRLPPSFPRSPLLHHFLPPVSQAPQEVRSW